MVLNVFWGRARWPRMKLREVIYKNHQKSFGLYRAKETRFAGRYRELGRLLRCKGDLREIVITDEYEDYILKASSRYAKRVRKEDDDDPEEDDDGGDGNIVKEILLDDGFWVELLQVLE
eukprot:6185846-Pleurochrysis_carterae.AAC.2